MEEPDRVMLAADERQGSGQSAATVADPSNATLNSVWTYGTWREVSKKLPAEQVPVQLK